jgi:hypothetical protein
MTFHRCFLLNFGSFGKAVSEEKIFRNRPITKTNCLWWPCLLTNRDNISNLYRGPSKDASYQISVHLAKQFQRRRFLYARLETGRIMWLGMAGGRPHRFPHNNFSSIYRIFTKLSHMIPLWKGKNPIYFGVIRSKVSYYKYNFWQQGRFHITLVLYIGSLPNLTTRFPCARTIFILGSLGQRSRLL